MPAGNVVLIQRDPPAETTEGGLYIPKTAQMLECFGTILHAGLAARDVMWDNGHAIGDYIAFGKFASILGEWDRLDAIASDPTCVHEWDRGEVKNEWWRKFKCGRCGVGRTQEAIAMMLVEDIKVNFTAEERIRKGEMRIVRVKTKDGTQHQVERAPFDDDVTPGPVAMDSTTDAFSQLNYARNGGTTNGRI
jgi:co-chaperonin GroES (HSP10)